MAGDNEQRIADSLWEIASFIRDNRKNLNMIIKSQAKLAEFELNFFRKSEEVDKKIEELDENNQTIVS